MSPMGLAKVRVTFKDCVVVNLNWRGVSWWLQYKLWPIFKWDHFSCWSIKVIKQGSWGHVQLSTDAFDILKICKIVHHQLFFFTRILVLLHLVWKEVRHCLLNYACHPPWRFIKLTGRRDLVWKEKRFNLLHLPLSPFAPQLVGDLSNWHLRPCNQCGKGLQPAPLLASQVKLKRHSGEKLNKCSQCHICTLHGAHCFVRLKCLRW